VGVVSCESVEPCIPCVDKVFVQFLYLHLGWLPVSGWVES